MHNTTSKFEKKSPFFNPKIDIFHSKFKLNLGDFLILKISRLITEDHQIK